MKRGIVFYAKDGHKLDYKKCRLDFKKELNHAVSYAQKTGLPISVITDEHTHIDNQYLDRVLRVQNKEINNKTGFGIKSFIHRESPYETTLLLDTDAIIVDADLSFGFEMAELHGMSLCIDNHYHLQSYYHAVHTLKEMNVNQECLIQYNGGVIFINQIDKRWNCCLARWNKLVSENDFIPQVALSALFYEMQLNPFVLTEAWNYRPHYKSAHQCGPIKIWHSREVLPNEESALFYNRSSTSRNNILM